MCVLVQIGWEISKGLMVTMGTSLVDSTLRL